MNTYIIDYGTSNLGSIYQAIDKLEERNGKCPDTEEFRKLIDKTFELCQEIR